MELQVPSFESQKGTFERHGNTLERAEGAPKRFENAFEEFKASFQTGAEAFEIGQIALEIPRILPKIFSPSPKFPPRTQKMFPPGADIHGRSSQCARRSFESVRLTRKCFRTDRKIAFPSPWIFRAAHAVFRATRSVSVPPGAGQKEKRAPGEGARLWVWSCAFGERGSYASVTFSESGVPGAGVGSFFSRGLFAKCWLSRSIVSPSPWVSAITCRHL